ncbi:tape measure protein [Spiribacter halobius]|uniref:Tape measure protein N-terminal domain-containing protein n=1 Tax=Sediminicurvatus halobius TaxID=2182432 RepID=A0A2U2MXP1_9GAMM|nr:tape measure protein [Spiribacter halobius]PWG61775.1 hypothetical protein DEM34_15020 [Spiribacter halobius]UEX76790.1 tape measure protein [Spiribacter halobius]
MADSAVELLIRANLTELTRGIQQGRSQFEREVLQMAESARRSANTIEGSFSRLGVRSTSQIRAEIVETRRAYTNLARSSRVSSRDLANASRAAKARIAELNRELRTGNQAAAGFGGGLRGIAGRLAGIAAATITVRSAFGFVQQILQTGSAFETLDVRLQSLTGSAEEAERASEWIKEFTATTPFQLREVAEAFSRLQAFGLDPLDGSLQAIADQTAALGGGQQELTGIVLALGQAWSKEKLQAEEALQLIERGVPVWELLADAMGRSSRELQEMASNGELGRDAIRALIREMGERNVGAAAAQMETFAGLVSNLRDNWERFLGIIADAGVLDAFKDQIDAINTSIEELAETGELEEIAERIAEAIVEIATALRDGVVFVYEYREAIAALVAVLATLKLATLAAGFAEVTTRLRANARAADAAAASYRRLAVAQSSLGFGRAATGAGRLLQQLGRFALRGAPPAAAAIVVYELGSAIFRVAAAGQEAARDIVEVQRAVARLEEESGSAANVQRLNQQALENLTRAELASYETRLEAARDYYQRLVGLAERRPDLIEGEPKTALQDYETALEELAEIQEERERREERHSERVSRIKGEELAAIRSSLDDQVEAYKEANKRLERVQQERARIAQSFQELEAELTASPQTPDEQLDAADLARQGDLVQGSLSQGRPEEALRRAERAREIIRTLGREGQATQQYLVTQTRRFAELAEEAAGVQEEQAKAEVAEIRKEIEELASKAAGLRNIEIGFDETAAARSADSLRTELQQRLAQNPIILPVKLDDNTSTEAILEQLPKPLPGRATGGPIFGPGTSTSDSIPVRLSRGEYVIRAAAVQRYGMGLLDRINRLQLPGLAAGGAVRALPAISSRPAASPPASSERPLTLVLDGQRYEARADTATGQSLERQLRLEALRRGR